MHRESDIRFEISELDCVQGPLPCYEIHKGPETKTNIAITKTRVLEQKSSRMTGTKILGMLFQRPPNGALFLRFL